MKPNIPIRLSGKAAAGLLLSLVVTPAFAGLTTQICKGYNYLQNDIAMLGGAALIIATFWRMATGEGDPKEKTKIAIGGLGLGGLVVGPSALTYMGVPWCAGTYAALAFGVFA